jgi:hypothetical protein
VTGEGLAAVERAIGRGGDADDILRAVVNALVEDGACRWAGIFFAENGELVLGPEAGLANPEGRARAGVAYRGHEVAELAADGCVHPRLLDEVAAAIAPYCLVGWDTGGVPWDEAG